jgi:hypothetical protein
MGNNSLYIGSRGNASNYEIDWESIDTELLFKSSRLEYCYKNCKNLEEIGEAFNESKLFGYFDYDLIMAIHELNAFLLPLELTDERPVLYYEWEGGNIAYGLQFDHENDCVNQLSFDYEYLVSERMTSDEFSDVIKVLPDLEGWEFSDLLA